jgi:para-nitrobenzyl esterase
MTNLRNRAALPRAVALLAAALLAAAAVAEEKPMPVGDEKTTPGAQPPGPAVMTDSGQVRGLLAGRSGDVLAYKGIPYAKPPVGELRWKEPQPPQKWQGVRDCFKFGNACPQRPAAYMNALPQMALNAPTNEDCLYLNVWSPAKPAGGKLPVLVWIHGGGYVNGAASQPLYDGESLARRGAVVVSMNYRLGPFGFLAHPALSKESAHRVSGNYGLLDQIAALRWVKQNVANFGGDPDRVSVFGESAGGGSVLCLMSSPLARGLFHGAIAQSAGAGRVASLRPTSAGRPSAEEFGVAFAEKCGVPPAGDAAALRKLDAETLLKTAPNPEAARSTAGRRFGAFAVSFAPVADGYVVSDAPAAVFAAGKESPVPLIIGHTRDETTFFLAQMPIAKTAAEYRKQLDENFGPLAPEVAALYPVEGDKQVRDVTSRLLTDLSWAAPTRHLARLHAANGHPTYRYVFSRGSRLPFLAPLGAHHGCELAYVFGQVANADAAEKKLEDLVQAYWVNFAAKGNPNNGADLPKWPRFSADKDALVEFENGAEVREGYRAKQFDLMDKLARSR